MTTPKKLGGRPKGVPNKITGQAKENIAAVFTRLGGTAAMARWAKENQTDFYKIYARLVPLEGPGANGEFTFHPSEWLREMVRMRG